MSPGVRLAQQLDRLDALLAGDAERFAAATPDDELGELTGFVVRHQMAIPALRRLARTGAVCRVPTSLIERLRQRDALQRERTARLVALHGRLREELDDAGIDALLLKGPTLSRRLFGSLDARESVDLDLLVRRRDLAGARAALRRRGFRRRALRGGGAALVAPFVHAFDFDSLGGSVDLHWALERHPSLRLDGDRLWATAHEEPLGDGAARVLADEGEILAAALGAVRDGERGRLKLKNLYDLRRWMELPAPWAGFLDAARAQRAARPCLRALAVAGAAFGVPRGLPEELDAALRGPASTAAAAVLPDLLAGQPSWTARRWAFASWESPAAANAAWWLASLPARLAVHGRQRPPRSPAAPPGLR